MRLNLKFESYCISRWARGKVLSVIEMGNWAPQTVRRSRNPPSARNSGVEGPLDRQNLVITFMLLVKQCNWTSLLAGLAFLLSCFLPSCPFQGELAVRIPGRRSTAHPILSGNENGAKSVQLPGEIPLSDYATTTSRSMSPNVLCNAARHWKITGPGHA